MRLHRCLARCFTPGPGPESAMLKQEVIVLSVTDQGLRFPRPSAAADPHHDPPLLGRRHSSPGTALPPPTQQPQRIPLQTADRIGSLRQELTSAARPCPDARHLAREGVSALHLHHPPHPALHHTDRPCTPQTDQILTSPLRSRSTKRDLAIGFHPLASGR
jgi:hypothetical protein